MRPRTALLALLAHLALLASVAAIQPAPAAPPTQHPSTLPAPPHNLTNVVLVGRVVTMNAANEVLQNGYVWIRNGVIEAVASDRATLEANASDGEALRAAPEVEVRGTIYPGMIDLHNHPEYAIYPLLPITRKYKDRYEWRFYDDDYARRITHLNTIITGAAYLDMGLDVGRYGEVKALVGGTTSLQGARAALAYAKTECLVRNIETTPVGTRRAFSRVDIGRDAAEWQRMAEERDQGVLVVHLAEGVGPRMAAEYDALKRSGLVGPQLIAIHGIALTATQLQDLAAAGGKLVWSPLSNYLLYGETANMRAAKAAGVPISLAPDWTPSGSKSILGELKVADLANRYSLDGLFSDRDLVAMVTRNPAAAMGWQGKLGTIAPGHFADIVVTDSVVDDAYRNLITATEANIKLVVVRGEALYGDRVLMTVFRSPRAMESLAPIGERRKVVAAQCPGSGLPDWSLEESAARLQQALSLDIKAFTRAVTIEQFTRDLLLCGSGKPSDPPSVDDAKRLLACRFNLPFEPTRLSPLVTEVDDDFFGRLDANPNVPRWLKRGADGKGGLAAYYARRAK